MATKKKTEPVKDLPAGEKADEIKGGWGDPHIVTPTTGGIVNPIVKNVFPK
ncbi:MAG: hypothetical protein U0Q55_22690 [Vicinamibacterales bacterium]